MLGLISLLKKSISPFLSMPTSNTANFALSGVLKILRGTPYLLLKELFEKYVFFSFFRQKPVNSFTDVFPAEPVIAIVLIFVDSTGGWFDVDSGWVDLLKSLLITVYVAYFGSRGAEKFKSIQNNG